MDKVQTVNVEYIINPNNWIKQEHRVFEDGIYAPCEEYALEGNEFYKLVIPREIFIEAYNKWIAPVVHAKWCEINSYDDLDSIIFTVRYFCSNCKCEEDYQSDYCPNCGAKMDLED